MHKRLLTVGGICVIIAMTLVMLGCATPNKVVYNAGVTYDIGAKTPTISAGLTITQ